LQWQRFQHFVQTACGATVCLLSHANGLQDNVPIAGSIDIAEQVDRSFVVNDGGVSGTAKLVPCGAKLNWRANLLEIRCVESEVPQEFST
jgi:hypothetical protein